MEATNDYLDVYKEPKMRRPRMLLSFSDSFYNADNISTSIGILFDEQLGAERFARIANPDHFYTSIFSGVGKIGEPYMRLDGGVVTDFSYGNEFCYSERGNLITFHGRQPHLHAEGYCDSILELASRSGVADIYFVGGVFKQILPHTREPKIVSFVSRPDLKERLRKYELMFFNGMIAGDIVGLLTNRSAHRGIGMTSLVVETMPTIPYIYTTSLLKAGLTIADLLGLDIDFKEWRKSERKLREILKSEVKEKEGLQDFVTRLEQQYDQEEEGARPEGGEKEFESLMGFMHQQRKGHQSLFRTEGGEE